MTDKKPLIVGIDPGNTSAVAALNLEGEIELLKSQREFPREQIIEELIATGKTVVVASDRANMPSNVEKIGQSLGAERFSPEEDLKTRRKKELGEGENSHEKDAVASARYAFNNLRKEIRKIKKIAEKYEKAPVEAAKHYFSDKTENLEESVKKRSE